jgi:hypothetical protein
MELGEVKEEGEGLGEKKAAYFKAP